MFDYSKTRRSAFRAVAALALTVATSATAFAQSTILVVDTAKVYNDSKVGQHVTRQLESMKATDVSTLKARATPLESSYKSLQTQLDGKTQAQVAGDAALKSRIETFQKDTAKLQQDGAIAQAELEMTERKARGLVAAKMKTIIDRIAKERNADVVLERQLVIYGEPADITTTVIARLDSEMTTVPVNRERLPRG